MGSTRAGKDRDRLLANGLAHKIRNSLNAMRAHLALMQKFASPCPEPRLFQQIDRLEQAVVGLEEIMKEYLALASPEKDVWEEVELGALVREVLHFTGLDLEQAGVKVIEELPPAGHVVYVDRAKLKRVLLNLIVNARQAMPEGGCLTVRVAATRRGQVVLEVGDTGVGIPDEERDQIFQPFFSSRPGGLGLGLAVVKRIVEDFRGRISFESRVGQGTTFRVVLPAASRRRAALERQARRQQHLQPAS